MDLKAEQQEEEEEKKNQLNATILYSCVVCEICKDQLMLLQVGYSFNQQWYDRLFFLFAIFWLTCVTI